MLHYQINTFWNPSVMRNLVNSPEHENPATVDTDDVVFSNERYKMVGCRDARKCAVPKNANRSRKGSWWTWIILMKRFQRFVPRTAHKKMKMCTCSCSERCPWEYRNQIKTNDGPLDYFGKFSIPKLVDKSVLHSWRFKNEHIFLFNFR